MMSREEEIINKLNGIRASRGISGYRKLPKNVKQNIASLIKIVIKND